MLEELVVFVWDAEHLADHLGGHRKRELGDDVGGLRARQDRVDALVGDLLDRGPQALDALEGERLGQHPAEPGVLLGVGGEHRPRPLVHRGEHVLVPVREAVEPVVDADARIGEQLPRHLVPGDQPGRAAVPDPHPGKRFGLAHLEHLRRRREGAPGVAVHRVLGDVGGDAGCVCGQGVGHGVLFIPRCRWPGPGRPRRPCGRCLLVRQVGCR